MAIHRRTSAVMDCRTSFAMTEINCIGSCFVHGPGTEPEAFHEQSPIRHRERSAAIHRRKSAAMDHRTGRHCEKQRDAAIAMTNRGLFMERKPVQKPLRRKSPQQRHAVQGHESLGIQAHRAAHRPCVINSASQPATSSAAPAFQPGATTTRPAQKSPRCRPPHRPQS